MRDTKKEQNNTAATTTPQEEMHKRIICKNSFKTGLERLHAFLCCNVNGG